jgi:VWFA-related protein
MLLPAARRVLAAAAALAALTAAPAAGRPAGEQEPRRPPVHAFGERIEVHRLTVDVRVIDGRGDAVAGLGPEDFRVELHGRPVEVEAVDWRRAGEAELAWQAAAAPAPDGETDAAAAPPASSSPAAPGGGLVVIFLQSADFYMETKAVGHLRMLPRVERFIAGLAPGEQAAVLRYGGSLELEMDFTADRERLRAAVRRAVLGGPRPPPVEDPRPSLGAHFDAEAARRAATPERALAVAGRALAALPGAKTMVFVGWGLGDCGLGAPLTPRRGDGDAALDALAAGRVAVFVLDVTSADAHCLEVGLRYVADVTGGAYASTFHFPDGALRRLERALAGSYTLVLRAPRLGPGRHPLRVRLAPRADGFGRWVLAPDAVFVNPG